MDTPIVTPHFINTEIRALIVLNNSDDDMIFEINPTYQRGLVWKDANSINFIDTIMLNYPCPNIMINIDVENNKLIIMDGKQRLTAIFKFRKNEIYWIDKNNNNIHVYYDKLPDGLTYTYNRICDISERNRFNNHQIQTIRYDNLTYETQVNIFERVQNGVVIRHSDLVISYFRNEAIAKTFKLESAKILNNITNLNLININYITNIENFRIIIIKCIHFMKNPWTILTKDNTKSYLSDMNNADIKKIFLQLEKIFNNIVLLKEIKIPDNYYQFIVILFLSFKYKDAPNLIKTINYIMKKSKNNFENIIKLTPEELIIQNKDIKNLKKLFDKKINSDSDIKEILKRKSKDELKQLIDSSYIKNASSFTNNKLKINELEKYYIDFGLEL